MKHLLADFMQVTELAALSVSDWIGKGDKNAADAAATSAMRDKLNSMDMSAVVVIGEGEMDEAPMLAIGERLGTGACPQLDIAVDPLEGTHAAALNENNAMSVLAAAPKGSLLNAPDMYMQKIAVGPKARGVIDIEASLEENVTNVARALDKSISDINVSIQDRERHRPTIERIIKIGANVHLFSVNDIVAGMSTSISRSEGEFGSPLADIFIGTGGAPEGVILAVAMKCLGGDMQAKLLPRDEEEYNRCIEMGIQDPRKSLTLNDMVNTNECLFVATGVTDSSLLKGIYHVQDGLAMQSLFIKEGHSSITYFESLYPE